MTEHQIPDPDHPLAHHKSGAPRGQIHTLYFGGYYYIRLHNSPLTVLYRPTEVVPGYGAKGLHSGYWRWPMPKGFMANPEGKGYIPIAHWRRKQRRAEARWNAGRW